MRFIVLFCFCYLSAHGMQDRAYVDLPESIKRLSNLQVTYQINRLFSKKPFQKYRYSIKNQDENFVPKKMTFFKIHQALNNPDDCKCYRCNRGYIKEEIANCDDCFLHSLNDINENDLSNVINLSQATSALSLEAIYGSILNEKRRIYADIVLDFYTQPSLLNNSDHDLIDQIYKDLYNLPLDQITQCIAFIKTRAHILSDLSAHNMLTDDVYEELYDIRKPLMCKKHNSIFILASKEVHITERASQNTAFFLNKYLTHITDDDRRIFLQFLKDGFFPRNRVLTPQQSLDFIKTTMGPINWLGYEFAVHFVDEKDNGYERFSIIFKGNEYVKITQPRFFKGSPS